MRIWLGLRSPSRLAPCSPGQRELYSPNGWGGDSVICLRSLTFKTSSCFLKTKSLLRPDLNSCASSRPTCHTLNEGCVVSAQCLRLTGISHDTASHTITQHSSGKWGDWDQESRGDLTWSRVSIPCSHSRTQVSAPHSKAHLSCWSLANLKSWAGTLLWMTFARRDSREGGQ